MAGRQNGASEQDCEAAVLRCVAGYRAEVRDLAVAPLLARSYQRLEADRLQQSAAGKTLRAEIKRPPPGPAAAPATGCCPSSPPSATADAAWWKTRR